MRVGMIKAVNQNLCGKIICDQSSNAPALLSAERLKKSSLAYLCARNEILCQYRLAAELPVALGADYSFAPVIVIIKKLKVICLICKIKLNL